jgi:hypothetical protein
MSQLRTNAILDASGGNTATFNGLPLRPGVLDPENRIINGAFDFWQRGTSSTSAAYVAADRWRNDLTGGTVTQSRQSFTVGDTLGNNSPTFFLRQTVSGQTLASQGALTCQRIEGVRSYAGQTITILGWARRSSGSGNVAVELLQSFGTGGSPSTEVNSIGVTTVTLTGSWAAFAVTIAVPSITGKTLGSNGNDYLELRFWTSAGSDYNARTNSLGLQTIGVDLWGIHIKQGTHTVAAADLYKQPELGPELARCQRYYEKSYSVGVAPGTNTSEGATVFAGSSDSANLSYCTIYYAVQKRAVPSLVGYRHVGTVNVWDYTRSGAIGGTGAVGAAVPFPGTKSGILSLPVGAAFVPVAIYGHWVADAEL